jgi:hypothetical protein
MKGMKFISPDQELLKLKKEDVGTTLYCNSFLDGKKMGGLLLVCDNALMKKLNISLTKAMQHPSEFAFRMFKLENILFEEYFFEFDMYFEGEEKSVKFHFDSSSTFFRDFCKQTIKNKYFGILFYNVEEKKMQSIFTNLQDEEDLDWLVRNLEISKNNKITGMLKKLIDMERSSEIIIKQDPMNLFLSNYYLQNSNTPAIDVLKV